MDALNEKWFNVRVFMNRVVEHRVFEGIILFLIAASSISLVSITAYMPYLTMSDKISQNLVLLKADSHKIFNFHRIFRPSKNSFHIETIINHT